MFDHITPGIKHGSLFGRKSAAINSNKLNSFQSYGKNVTFNA